MTERGERLRRVVSLLGLAILVGLLVLAARRLDLAHALQALASARLPWIVAALACYVAILPLWGVQWWLLAPCAAMATPARMVGVVAMTSSVLNTTPLLVGEAAGVHFLAERAGVDRGSGLAVLAMDQLLVGLAKLVVLACAASVLPLPPAMRDGIRAFAAVVLLLLTAMVLLSRSGAATRRRLVVRMPLRLGNITERAINGLAPLRSPLRGGGAFALALLKKACELLAILAIQRAFGVELAAGSAFVVLAALNLATLLPLVPGNAGIFEAAVVLAYGWLGVPPERALGMALVQHAAYFAALALPGYGWLARAVPPRSAAAAP